MNVLWIPDCFDLESAANDPQYENMTLVQLNRIRPKIRPKIARFAIGPKIALFAIRPKIARFAIGPKIAHCAFVTARIASLVPRIE